MVTRCHSHTHGPEPASRRRIPAVLAALCLLLSAWIPPAPAAAPAPEAEVQFDVFFGYDDRVRGGHWFPVTIEILNAGPTFTGTVLLGPEDQWERDPQALRIELPTNTRKRALITLFAATGRTGWDIRLLDDKGTLIAEKIGVQPRTTGLDVPLLGALPRMFGGLPTLPAPDERSDAYLPAVARLQSDYLPANPLGLDGLTAIYLNSEKATDLRPEQVDALLAWIHAGGHLIVAIEQPGDVLSLAWLKGVLPFAPESATEVAVGTGLDAWIRAAPGPQAAPESVRRLGRRPSDGQARQVEPATADDANPYARVASDDAFNAARLPVVTGRIIEGRSVVHPVEAPLVVSARRGLGTVTALTFSPEREPFRTWKNRSWFWARLTGVPAELLGSGADIRWGGQTLDALFGAVLDSRQVRKLPVGALLLLLVVYLIVIGPFDRWILKRSGREMWTWITFPTYVALFSALIYVIGYRLRAGDLEWNEVQVVDQLPRGTNAAFRGRTWISIYSPANARYRLASEQPFATVRAEYGGGGSAVKGTSQRLDIQHTARGFGAEIHVPVWVNQLFCSDWFQPGPAAVTAEVHPAGDGHRVALRNRSELPFTDVAIVVGGAVHKLGELPPGGVLTADLRASDGVPLQEFLAERRPRAMTAAAERRQAFGNTRAARLTRNLDAVILASFADWRADPPVAPQENFHAPPQFDLSDIADDDRAVVLAWSPGRAMASPIHRFSPRRLQRDLALRIAVPTVPASPP